MDDVHPAGLIYTTRSLGPVGKTRGAGLPRAEGSLERFQRRSLVRASPSAYCL